MPSRCTALDLGPTLRRFSNASLARGALWSSVELVARGSVERRFASASAAVRSRGGDVTCAQPTAHRLLPRRTSVASASSTQRWLYNSSMHFMVAARDT